MPSEPPGNTPGASSDSGIRGLSCVILQPSYIPWRGYFHQIRKADIFVFYDDVQYDRHGWRNRNRIKTPAGPKWLTIPLHATGKSIEQSRICDMRTVEETNWRARHFETLRHNYTKAPYFAEYRPMLERWYSEPAPVLADFTIGTTIDLARELGITKTQFIRSSALGFEGTKTERLLHILLQVGAKHYISGPSARDYLDESLLKAHDIEVEWMRYAYGEYPQLHPPFDPQLSALDLLLNTGPAAGSYIWGAEPAASAHLQ